MRMFRVVIDTNILIGAQYDEFSFSRRIVDLVVSGKIRAVASRATLRENKALLKRAVRDRRWHREVCGFFDAVEYVLVRVPRRKKPIVREDPEDDKFIYTAIAGGATHIITSDAHLLDLEEHEGIRICTPRDFWYEYQEKERSAQGDTEWKEWVQGLFS